MFSTAGCAEKHSRVLGCYKGPAEDHQHEFSWFMLNGKIKALVRCLKMTFANG